MTTPLPEEVAPNHGNITLTPSALRHGAKVLPGQN